MTRIDAVLERARLRRVDLSNPLLSDLPSWVESFRPHQVDAITKIVSGLEDHDLVVLDAPTGAGKTLIAEAARRIGGYDRTIYICSSKGLQDQFQADFPYAKVLKGRRNYPTELYPERFGRSGWAELTCGDCTRTKDTSCKWCEEACPYDMAKGQALAGQLAVLNTAYFLAESNGPGRFGSRDLVICDECDTLEKELMNYVSVSISGRTARKYGINPPPTVTSRKSWPEWFSDTLDRLREERLRSRRKINEYPDPQAIRDFVSLDRWVSQVQSVSEGLDSDLWVYTGRDDHIEFKPVSVQAMGDKLWLHGKKFLLMSATVISAETLVREVGWEESYTTVTVGSTFPTTNRPIYVQPVASMSKKESTTSLPMMVTAIRTILTNHSHERVLIHCVSYELGRALACGLVPCDRSVLTYGSAGEKERVVQSFKELEGSVLVAPSLERGVDLPDDLCRVQVIAKVPFPYLGDRQVSARLHSPGGQSWYTVCTVRSIVQSTGRGVRHADDWAVSYILDSQFLSNVWGRNRNLFPEWWREAVIWNKEG